MDKDTEPTLHSLLSYLKMNNLYIPKKITEDHLEFNLDDAIFIKKATIPKSLKTLTLSMKYRMVAMNELAPRLWPPFKLMSKRELSMAILYLHFNIIPELNKKSRTARINWLFKVFESSNCSVVVNDRRALKKHLLSMTEKNYYRLLTLISARHNIIRSF